MRTRTRALVPALLLLASCTGSGPSSSKAQQAGRSATDPGPEPWAREATAPGECRWAGLRFSVDDFAPAPPSYQTDEGVACIRSGRCDWLVEREPTTGRVVVTEGSGRADPPPPFELPQEPEFTGTPAQLRTSDGWLLGFDRGEFGGSLWWFSPDGRRHHRVEDPRPEGSHLGELDVHTMLSVDDQAYVITSMNHMRAREGALLRFGWGERMQPVLRVITALPFSPMVVIPGAPGEVLVADEQGLYGLGLPTGRMERVHASVWEGLYLHHGVLADDGSIVLSGRHVLVHLRPDARGYVETMMVPPPCTSFTLDREHAGCACG